MSDMSVFLSLIGVLVGSHVGARLGEWFAYYRFEKEERKRREEQIKSLAKFDEAFAELRKVTEAYVLSH